jgi:hypothetical protein
MMILLSLDLSFFNTFPVPFQDVIAECCSRFRWECPYWKNLEEAVSVYSRNAFLFKYSEEGRNRRTFERCSRGSWSRRVFRRFVTCKMPTRILYSTPILINNDFLQKFGKGLDEVRPFSQYNSVDVILRASDQFFSPDGDVIGYAHAGRIWSFVSKFVMLDRFAKALDLTKTDPALPLPRKTFSSNYIGTASKVRIDLPYEYLKSLLILYDFRY